MPRKTDSNNPADWLAIAASELEALDLLAEREIGYNMCCGKLAEVLEKLLKAELIRHGWQLERTHDLEKLRKELKTLDEALANTIQPLSTSLAEVYFTGRYPGFDLEEPNWPDFRLKLAKTRSVFEQIEKRVAKT